MEGVKNYTKLCEVIYGRPSLVNYTFRARLKDLVRPNVFSFPNSKFPSLMFFGFLSIYTFSTFIGNVVPLYLFILGNVLTMLLRQQWPEFVQAFYRIKLSIGIQNNSCSEKLFKSVFRQSLQLAKAEKFNIITNYYSNYISIMYL